MAELSHAMIFVRDMARSVAFYRDLLGLPIRFESAKWTEFETPGSTLALHLADVHGKAATLSADEIPAGVCHPIFVVDDIDAFHEKMDANGVRCLQPPKEEDFGGKLAGYADPDGLPFWVGDNSGKA